MSLLVNFTLYQIGWFAVVLGAASNRPWSGMTLALTLVVVHLALVRGVSRHFCLVLVSGTIGFTLDSLQIWLGVFQFPSGQVTQQLAPPWDAVLWMQFATLLPFCLRWVSHRYMLCCLLGLAGGPMAFYAGEQFGAVHFPPPRMMHFAILAAVWAFAFPLLVWLSDKLVIEPGFGGRYRFAASEHKAYGGRGQI